MVSTVRSRPNFYEVLGIATTAAADEIRQAFAREISVLRPRAFGGIAEVSIAYETLRNPAKRRAYDASIGLYGEPERPSTPLPSFLVAGPAKAVELPVARPLPRPAPMPQTNPAAASQAWSMPEAPRERPRILAMDEDLDAGARPIGWKRTGIALGGLALAASLIGAMAGLWSGSEASEPKQPERAALVSPKPDATGAVEAAPSFTYAPAPIEARRDQPRRVMAARAERKISDQAVAQEQPLDSLPADDATEPNPPNATASEQSIAEPAVSAVAASMPLPKKLIARTIHRIGYSCGSVAFTSPMEDVPGGYIVTCTSGQAFRASPVNGRYHFKRVDKQ